MFLEMWYFERKKASKFECNIKKHIIDLNEKNNHVYKMIFFSIFLNLSFMTCLMATFLLLEVRIYD
jgi:hypothetical protein